MSVGSCGIFYCSETKSLTTPFLVYSKPDRKVEVQNVWSKNWFYHIEFTRSEHPTSNCTRTRP